MMRLWTIIGVCDVSASLAWYQRLLGLPLQPPAHSYFGQVVDTDGTVLVCLHEWGEHDHPTLASPDRIEPGNGLLLFFRVADFDAADNIVVVGSTYGGLDGSYKDLVVPAAISGAFQFGGFVAFAKLMPETKVNVRNINNTMPGARFSTGYFNATPAPAWLGQ